MDNLHIDLDIPSQALISNLECQELLTIQSLTGGRNNRTYLLECRDTRAYVMKRYFRHRNDPRDRCRAEWELLQYAQRRNISCVPTPIACDPVHGITIMGYINGRKLNAGEVTGDHIRQALAFFVALNTGVQSAEKFALPPASESCFSIHDHISCVNRRIENLKQMRAESAIDRAAGNFIQEDLIPQWNAIRNGIKEAVRRGKIDTGGDLHESDICISPSDFGFHNAILTETGRVCFIDFEYAGRDDPVKMICDFFCQPEVPVPRTFLPGFADTVLQNLDKPDTHKLRLDLLLPVHTIKWCCILLNEFLPTGQARRVFASTLQSDQDKRKRVQLEKAEQMLSLCQ